MSGSERSFPPAGTEHESLSAYVHYHPQDGEIRFDCEACIEEWIADIQSGGATRESAVAAVDRAIQEGGRAWWCS